MPKYGDLIECEVKDIDWFSKILAEQATLSMQCLEIEGGLLPQQRVRFGWKLDTALDGDFF